MTGVIVGVDDSDTAREAARRGAVLAEALGEELHLVMALAPERNVTIEAGGERYVHDHVSHAAERLHGLRVEIGAPNATTSIGGKDPAKVLTNEAERLDASMIVVGNRRVSGVGRVLGSIATEVIRTAPCDVMVVDTRSARLAGGSSGDASAESTGEVGLATSPLFAGCTPRERRRIDELTTTVQVGAGRRLTSEGRPGREFGVIVSGSATVTVDGEVVATLGPGDHYGEMALLAAVGAPVSQSATIVTDVAATVAVMSVQEFETLTADQPEIAERLRETAAARA
ncbi:MAG: universal stress protein [Actinomycetota bacterium]